MTYVEMKLPRIQCDGRPGTHVGTCDFNTEVKRPAVVPNGWLSYNSRHLCPVHVKIMRRGEFTFEEWATWDGEASKVYTRKRRPPNA